MRAPATNMIPQITQKEVQEVYALAIRHLKNKLALQEECQECGCKPINSGELTALFGAIKNCGVETVEADAPVAQPKPSGPVAFPVKTKAV